MPRGSLPLLDIQTEHLDRNQYPSGRLLLIIAAIAGLGLAVSWGAHRESFPESGSVVAQGEQAPAAMRLHR